MRLYRQVKYILENEDALQQLQDDNLDPEEVKQLYYKHHADPQIRQKIASHPQLHPELIDNIFDFYKSDPDTMHAVSQNPNAKLSQMLKAASYSGSRAHEVFNNPAMALYLLEDPNAISKHGDPETLQALAYNHKMPVVFQRSAFAPSKDAYSDQSRVNKALAYNKNLDPGVAENLFHDALNTGDASIHETLAANPSIPESLVNRYLSQGYLIPGNTNKILSHPKISNDRLKGILSSPTLYKKSNLKDALDKFQNLAENPNMAFEDFHKLRDHLENYLKNSPGSLSKTAKSDKNTRKRGLDTVRRTIEYGINRTSPQFSGE